MCERFTAEGCLDGIDALEHAGHTTDENDLVELARSSFDTGISESLLAGLDGPLDKGGNRGLESKTKEHRLMCWD